MRTMQDFYRRGLNSLEAYCQKTYKASFVSSAPRGRTR